jgi:hypothetical protein
VSPDGKNMRVHLSRGPADAPSLAEKYPQSGAGMKPNGLWYDFDGTSWRQFAREAGFRYTHAYEVTLRKGATYVPPAKARWAKHPDRVLVLRTRSAIRRFQEAYGWPGPGRFLLHPPLGRHHAPGRRTGGPLVVRIGSGAPDPKALGSGAPDPKALGSGAPDPKAKHRDWVPNGLIDWEAVSRHYAGIELRHYTPDIRNPAIPAGVELPDIYCHPLNWAYAWDVASGCIWDAAAAVRRVRPLPQCGLGAASRTHDFNGNTTTAPNPAPNPAAGQPSGPARPCPPRT